MEINVSAIQEVIDASDKAAKLGSACHIGSYACAGLSAYSLYKAVKAYNKNDNKSGTSWLTGSIVEMILAYLISHSGDHLQLMSLMGLSAANNAKFTVKILEKLSSMKA